jgi:hypothetical protein
VSEGRPRHRQTRVLTTPKRGPALLRSRSGAPGSLPACRAEALREESRVDIACAVKNAHDLNSFWKCLVQNQIGTRDKNAGGGRNLRPQRRQLRKIGQGRDTGLDARKDRIGRDRIVRRDVMPDVEEIVPRPPRIASGRHAKTFFAVPARLAPPS